MKENGITVYFPQFYVEFLPKFYSFKGSLRDAFFSESFFFSLSRLSFAALEGFVFFRGFGFFSEFLSRSRNLLVTISLFLC